MREPGADAVGVGHGGEIAAGARLQRLGGALAGRLAVEIRGGAQYRDAVEVEQVGVRAALQRRQRRIVLLLRREGVGRSISDELGVGLHRRAETRAMPPGVRRDCVADRILRRRRRSRLGVFRAIGLGAVAVGEIDVPGQTEGRLQQVLVEAIDFVAAAQLGFLTRRRRANRQIARAPVGGRLACVDLVL